MDFQIDYRADLDREIVRVIRQEITSAILMSGSTKTPLADRIHHARAACKKARAALRLIRGKCPRLFARENAWMRDAGGRLARFRDIDVMLVCLGRFLAKRPASHPGRALLLAARNELRARQRQERSESTGVRRELVRFARRMRTASRRWGKQPLRGIDGELLADGFTAAYRRARRAMPGRRRSGARQFHDWRKATKSCGYQCRVLRDTWPAVMKALWHEFSDLGDMLGAEHDLSMLRHYLKDPDHVTTSRRTAAAGIRWVGQRRDQLRRSALEIGRRLFADKPRVMHRRLTQWSQNPKAARK